MKSCLIRCQSLACGTLALVAVAVIRLSSAAEIALTPPSPSATPVVPPAAEREAPAEVVKPIVPNRAELPDVAFKKLDAANKGYVTLEDVRGLDGFDKAFAAVDTRHTGRLDFAQFKKAWSMYSGYK